MASPKGQPGAEYILGTRLAAKEKHASINSGGGGGGGSSQAKAAQKRSQMTHNITALENHFESKKNTAKATTATTLATPTAPEAAHGYQQLPSKLKKQNTTASDNTNGAGNGHAVKKLPKHARATSDLSNQFADKVAKLKEIQSQHAQVDAAAADIGLSFRASLPGGGDSMRKTSPRGDNRDSPQLPAWDTNAGKQALNEQFDGASGPRFRSSSVSGGKNELYMSFQKEPSKSNLIAA